MQSKMLKSLWLLGGLLVLPLIPQQVKSFPNYSNTVIPHGTIHLANGVFDTLGFDEVITISGDVIVGAINGGFLQWNCGFIGTNPTVVQAIDRGTTFVDLNGVEADPLSLRYSHLMVYADADSFVEVNVGLDLIFTGSNYLTTPGDINSLSAAQSNHLNLTFSGDGLVQFFIGAGFTVYFDSEYDTGNAQLNTDFDFVPPGIADGAGTRTRITMDQNPIDVTNRFNKLVFSRYAYAFNGDPLTETEITTYVYIGRHSFVTYVSNISTGLVDDGALAAAMAFDISNAGRGRLVLDIAGDEFCSGLDGALNVVGYWVSNGAGGDGDLAIPNHVRLNTTFNQFAGATAVIRVIDELARVSDPVYLADLPFVLPTGGSRRSLLVRNYCNSLIPYASNVFFDDGWFNRGALVLNQPALPGCYLGINGQLDVYHNTFWDYVGLSINQEYSPSCIGSSNLANILYLSGFFAPVDVFKCHNGSAFVVDGLGGIGFLSPPFATPPAPGGTFFSNFASKATINLFGTGAFLVRNGASENGTFDDAPYLAGAPAYETFWLNIGLYQFDGNILSIPFASLVGNGETFGEGALCMDVEGPLSIYGRTEPDIFPPAGIFNIPTIKIDYAGREIFDDADISSSYLPRPLLLGDVLPRYNRSFMSMNADIDWHGLPLLQWGMTLYHNDLAHHVEPSAAAQGFAVSFSDPTYCGGEAAHYASVILSTGFPLPGVPPIPVWYFYNTLFSCRESMALSGFRIAVRDEVILDPGFVLPNDSSILAYNHGDVQDTYFRSYGRALVFGTDGNRTCPGNEFPEGPFIPAGFTSPILNSAFVNVFRHSSVVDSDLSPNNIWARLQMQVTPDPETVDPTQEAMQIFFLGNDSNMTLGWTFTVGSVFDEFGFEIFPWENRVAGDVLQQFSLDQLTDGIAPGHLYMDGQYYYFTGLNSAGFGALKPVTLANAGGVVYANYGSLISAKLVPPVNTFFDLPIAILLWKDFEGATPRQIGGFITIPNDQVKFGHNNAVQPYNVFLDPIGDFFNPYADLSFLINLGNQLGGSGIGGYGTVVQIAWNYIQPALGDGFVPVKADIDMGGRGATAGKPGTSKASTRTGKPASGRSTSATDRAMPSQTRCTIAATGPVPMVIIPPAMIANQYLDQMMISGATWANPAHLYFTGDATGYAYCREFVSVPSNPLIFGEGMHGAFFLDNGARIGLGSRQFNEFSVNAWNHLGEDWLTLYPNGNAVVELNSDIKIRDQVAIVPTENFGNVPDGQTHRLTFISQTPREIRVPAGGELSLTGFGQPVLTVQGATGVRSQQISLAGKVRLIFEPGSTLRFPNLNIEDRDKAPILYLDEESELIFDTWKDRGKEEPTTVSDNGVTFGLDKYRCKIKGVGKIWLNKDASIKIFDEAMVAVETDWELNACSENNPRTSFTDIEISLQRDSQFLIGDENNKGGSFQVGNPIFAVTELEEAVFPHSIHFLLRINGEGAHFDINRYGFFGLGAGVLAQNDDNINTWNLIALQNVDQVELRIVKGTFSHNNIVDGGSSEGGPEDNNSSLFAIGPVGEFGYTYRFGPTDQAFIRGGGNIVYVTHFNDVVDPVVIPDNPLFVEVFSEALELVNDAELDAGKYNIMASAPQTSQVESVSAVSSPVIIPLVTSVPADDPELYAGTFFAGTQEAFYRYVRCPSYRDTNTRWVILGGTPGDLRRAFRLGTVIVREEAIGGFDSNGTAQDPAENLYIGCMGAVGNGEAGNSVRI